jgi:hypothetical protein
MSSVADAGGSAETTPADPPAVPPEEPVATERAVTAGLGVKVALAVSFFAIAAIGTYNAWTYPARYGYDFVSHYTYAESLIRHGSIPSRSDGGEYYTPPGYYAIAGSVVWIGQELGMSRPARLGQQLNVLFVLATALLVLITARLLAPRRPVVWAASVGFLAFLPVVAKVEAMFHPESLNMLAAAGAMTLSTWMIVRRRYGKREFAALALVLAFGQLVRASAILTLLAIAIAITVAVLAERLHRRDAVRALGIGVAALVLLVTPWYVRQALKYHTATPVNVVPGFASTMLHPQHSFVETQGGLAHFFDLPVLELYRTPYREYFFNEAFPTTYAEMWGDWIGAWEWNLSYPPTKREVRILQDQVLIGAIPTLLAIGGVGWMLVAGLRRRRELLPVALVALIGLAGYLYRSYAAATNDGDLLKAAYALLTAPMWAIGFGIAFERLTRHRWAMAGLVALLAIFAVLELQVLVWGVRAGRFL